jgi:cellulose synthase/poly-beta-1,6-N-acetylglucosamine synthase-like glycosyltransferase
LGREENMIATAEIKIYSYPTKPCLKSSLVNNITGFNYSDINKAAVKHVDIIIPVFNEAENIIILVQEIKQVFESLPYSYFIIVVDDGSTDGTLSMLRCMKEILAIKMRLKQVSIIRKETVQSPWTVIFNIHLP